MKIIAIICGGVIAVALPVSSVAQIAQSVSKDQAEAAAAAVLVQVEALRRLRSGDNAGAIELLETSLDSNITILGGNDKLRCSSSIATIVEGAAEYRVKYPRSGGDANLNEHVAGLLKSCQKGQK
jgi:hypothetical protein